MHIRQIAIDTETTGLNIAGDDRVIEIGAVEIIDGVITGTYFQSYFCPEGKKSDTEAFQKHKIEDDFLQDKPLFKDKLSELLQFVGDSELLAYNASFDVKMLDSECELAGLDYRFSTEHKITCVMETLMERLNSCNRVSLDEACDICNIDRSTRNSHRAVIDAKLAAQVYGILQAVV